MEVDLAYLASLGLKEAFSGESAFEKIVAKEDYLTELFEQTDRSSVFVYDDESFSQTLLFKLKFSSS